MDVFLRNSGVPLYLQAGNALKRLIESEGWGKGARLPSLEVLAERFGVARLTMRQAVKKLEQEGLLCSRRGQGIVIVQEPPRPPRMHVYADLDNLISKSRASAIEELVCEEVSGCPLLAEAPQAAWYRHWVRVHSDDGIPYGFLNIYLNKNVYELAPDKFDRQPPMHVIRDLPEMCETSFRQVLTIRPAYPEVARHLRLDPGAPVAHFLRIGTGVDGTVLFVADVTYPGNQLLIDIAFCPGLDERLGTERRAAPVAIPGVESSGTTA